MKGFAQLVVVDESESRAMPAMVLEAYRKKGGSMPHVVFADPGDEEDLRGV